MRCPRNRVNSTATESTSFYYGPDRQYYRQVYTGPASPTGYEETHYVGGLLEKVSDGSTTDWRHYIQAEGQVVAIVSRLSTSANAVYYPLEDNQGSGSHLTSSSGAGIVRQSYAAFGLPRDGNDWDGAVPGGDQTAINAISRRGYTSHSMLGSMGLIHMNGRVQDAITGRFLSPDPNIPDPGFTQSYNRYAYVVNNPLSQIDPTGFMNAFMQAICSSGFNPWSPDTQAAVLAEQCFRAMSFSEAMESGWMVNIALLRANFSGCVMNYFADCDLQEYVQGQYSDRNRRAREDAGNQSWEGGVLSADASGPRGPASARQIMPTGAVLPPTGPTLQQGLVTEVHFSGLSRLHVFARHVWFDLPNTSRYAPELRNTNAINLLAVATAKVGEDALTLQGNGNYRTSVQFAFPIGVDQQGNPTNWNTIVIKVLEPSVDGAPGYAEVVTMHPGLPNTGRR